MDNLEMNLTLWLSISRMHIGNAVRCLDDYIAKTDDPCAIDLRDRLLKISEEIRTVRQ